MPGEGFLSIISKLMRATVATGFQERAFSSSALCGLPPKTEVGHIRCCRLGATCDKSMTAFAPTLEQAPSMSLCWVEPQLDSLRRGLVGHGLPRPPPTASTPALGNLNIESAYRGLSAILYSRQRTPAISLFQNDDSFVRGRSIAFTIPLGLHQSWVKEHRKCEVHEAIRGRHENGLVLVKVLVKPYADVKLQQYKKQIIDKIPNTLGFQRIIETETNATWSASSFTAHLRPSQHSTVPRGHREKMVGLPAALRLFAIAMHAMSTTGDIKAQNVLVTSWNWLYLSDFPSAYKPVMLPDDNPADFSYFFDTSGLRTCYIAPERFYASGEAPPKNAKMTWAMDIFSAGCVIAQLFLESDIFSLAQLYKYRRGEYDPVITHLSTIANKDLADMIAHMIQLDPEKRYSADQYLEFWKGKVFPHYFYNFLHQYMELITDPSSGNSPILRNVPQTKLQPLLAEPIAFPKTLRGHLHGIRACDVLLAFSERLTDEAKLDRVLPYLMTLLVPDETDLVLIAAIRTITQLLQLVQTVNAFNSHVLVEYVLPRMEIALGSRSRTPSSLVRAAYASCLGSLATTAQRFLNMASSLRADGSMPITDPEVEPGADAKANFESVFDNAGRQLLKSLRAIQSNW
ncbi:hypothetical protein Lal_00045022 [Lupinus albus]|nr:hypothetical protein Lal_00045022 [Lupinus albus]